MRSVFFNNVSGETAEDIQQASDQLHKTSITFQKEQIKAHSPYSEQINEAFSNYSEFQYLLSLGLKEADVTRCSLIKDIDPNLYVTEKKRTNYELMCNGLAPYVNDNADSCIVLHHIGQSFDAPFAELTIQEHAFFGNSKKLHSSEEDSWRQDPQKERAFANERALYWKKRARNEVQVLTSIEICNDSFVQRDYVRNNSRYIMETIERLFSECSTSDLAYISNLAQSRILSREIGAETIEEYILKSKEDMGLQFVCPVCGSENISFYGSYHTEKEKRRKYKCRDCEKVFSALYNTLIQGCSLSLYEWLRFIDCLYNGYSINKTAQLCNISEKTAFDNRLRLFRALTILDERVKLTGKIVIDETFRGVSYKGNHTLEKDFIMPRQSRKRGGENHTPGLSKEEQVSIACALDEYGVSVAKVSGRGKASSKRYEEALKKHIDESQLTSIYSDQCAAIRKFATQNNFPIKQSILRKPKRKGGKSNETIRQIERINAYHSRLDKFLDQFNGISSELLQGYASLFAWRDRNRHKPSIDAFKELMTILVTPNLYKPEDKIIEETTHNDDLDKKPKEKYKNSQSAEKSKKILYLYEKDVPVKKIAKKFKCTTQAITRRLRKHQAMDPAHKTKRDIKREEKLTQQQSRFDKRMAQLSDYRDYFTELLSQKESWDGTVEDFYLEMEKRYNLSRQTVKNHIATAKRIANLREVFYINKEYEYLTLEDVFQMVLSRYNELRDAEPSLKKYRILQMISEEFNYTYAMVLRIVESMQNETIDWSGKIKTKIPMAHTLNRDRSLFVDYLKWTGTRAEFLNYAACKYQISTREVTFIIRLNCIADPSRYEMSAID